MLIHKCSVFQFSFIFWFCQCHFFQYQTWSLSSSNPCKNNSMFSYTIGMTETNDQSWCFKRTPVGKQLSYLNLALCGCDKSVPVLSTVLASLCLNPSAVTLTPVCVECCNISILRNISDLCRMIKCNMEFEKHEWILEIEFSELWRVAWFSLPPTEPTDLIEASSLRLLMCLYLTFSCLGIWSNCWLNHCLTIKLYLLLFTVFLNKPWTNLQ